MVVQFNSHHQLFFFTHPDARRFDSIRDDISLQSVRQLHAVLSAILLQKPSQNNAQMHDSRMRLPRLLKINQFGSVSTCHEFVMMFVVFVQKQFALASGIQRDELIDGKDVIDEPRQAVLYPHRLRKILR